MRAGLADDGPTFIDVVVEPLAKRMPPVVSWLRKTGHDRLSLASEKLAF
ncbi:MAG: hypothetical protein AAGA70_04520 [Pseudomonadota bacterium]